MKNIYVKRKILAFMLVVSSLTSAINGAIAATPSSTPPPVISLGSWSLGDTFEIRYELENSKHIHILMYKIHIIITAMMNK